MNGVQLANHVRRINEGGYIRTTPTQSPRSSRHLGSYIRAAHNDSSPVPPSSNYPPSSTEAGPSSRGDHDDGHDQPTPTPTSPFADAKNSKSESKDNRRSATMRPPPILKNSSSGSSQSSNSPSILSSTENEVRSSEVAADHEDAVDLEEDPKSHKQTLPISKGSAPARRSNVTRFNEEVSVSIPKFSTSIPKSTAERPRKTSGEGSQKFGKRNPVIVASTGASKRRPTVMRQRSSQVSSMGASRNASFQNLARSPRPTSLETDDIPIETPGTPSARQARAASLHHWRQRIRLSTESPSSEEVSEASGDESTDKQRPPARPDVRSKCFEKVESEKPLVDPNFRANFVDQTRSSQRSLTSLSAFARKSSAAEPAAASYQASGMIERGQATTSSSGKGKGKNAFTNEIVPLKAPAASGPEPTDEESYQALPRTKSQLSLLLERERVRSASQEQTARKPEKS